MAHNINQMVYAGETPWHGLGVRLPRNGTWTEINAAAGFYRAGPRPLTMPDGFVIPDRKAIVREDTGAYLATVGHKYQILQFEDLARAGVIASAGVEAIWHTAGTLGEAGARGWLLAELPNPIRVKGDQSETRKYVLLTTAHDGTSAAILKNVATRVVCQNTLGAALGEADGAQWTIRHTLNAEQRLKDAATAFRNMAENFERFEQLANVLASVRFTFTQHTETINELMPLPEDGEAHPRIKNKRAKLSELFDTFIGNDGLRGTAWGAFQAWTEFVDHGRAADTTTKRDRHLESITLGAGADLKAKALAAIVARADISAANFATV